MTTRKILTLTLLATALTLNATALHQQVPTKIQQTNSISSQVANTLYRRGIEADRAKELSHSIIDTDEELFLYMVQIFSHDSGIAMNDIYNELAKMALNKKSVDFSSYSFLLKLTQNIKNEHLNATKLKNIEGISIKNQLLLNTFT